MTNPIELPNHLTEHFKKVLAVHLILIDRLTTITTRRHIVKRTTKFEANGSSHVSEPTQTNATMIDLTPYFFLLFCAPPFCAHAVPTESAT